MDLRLRLSAEFAHKIPVFLAVKFGWPARCLHGRSFGPFTFATASIIGVVSERFTFPACPVQSRHSRPPARRKALSLHHNYGQREMSECAAPQGPLPLTNCRLPPLVIWHIHNVTCSTEDEESRAHMPPPRDAHMSKRASERGRTRQN